MQPIELENTNIEDFKEPAENVAKYIHENKFEIIIVNGASAQTGAYLVKQAWKRLYPKEPMPKFGAIGFVHKTKKPYKSEKTGMVEEERIMQRLKQVTKGLEKSNCLIFDECSLQGNQLTQTASRLRNLGFSKIKTCALYHPTKNQFHKPIDFIASQGITTFPKIYQIRRNTFNAALFRTKLKELHPNNKLFALFARRDIKDLRRRSK
jgi:hypothetical protein